MNIRNLHDLAPISRKYDLCKKLHQEIENTYEKFTPVFMNVNWNLHLRNMQYFSIMCMKKLVYFRN